MKINFKQFPMYTGIDKKEMVACDVAYSLANNLYTKVPDNIGAHCLSEKIYNAEGNVDLSGQEIDIIRYAYPTFTGAFADISETIQSATIKLTIYVLKEKEEQHED